MFLPAGVAWDTNWSFGGTAGLSPAHYLPDNPVFRAGASYTTRRARVPARTSIELGSASLDGGVASYFVDEYQCAAPKRVLLRFRVVFARPASFTLDRDAGALRRLSARVPIRELKIAVRTDTGKPLVFLEALASGKARIFTGCQRRAADGLARHRSDDDLRDPAARRHPLLVAKAVTGIKESNRPLVWAQLPSITVSTGFNRWLASASAGAYPAPRGGWFAVSSTLCRAARANVALSPNGLTPEFVEQAGSQRRCLGPPRQVVVRVRATFTRPASLTRDTQYQQWRTTVPVRTAEIAARTLTGKPLAYARVFDDGRARLFAAPTCYLD